LAKRPIEQVKRVEIAARLQELIKEHGRAGASAARRSLSSMFGWAMREGLCESNPIISTNDPNSGAQPRERVLSDSEIVRVWRACDDNHFGRIVKLLLLTGCRRNEICMLEWSDLDLDRGTLTVPAERAKNGREHRLTLPPMALDIIKAIPRREGRAHVFGVRGAGYQHRHDFDPLRQRLGTMPRWTLHDLRRSCATGMAELGIAPNIIEAVLNHASGHKGGIAGIYNRASYVEPMRVALQRWADHVAALIDGRAASNVTPMRSVATLRR
jgi:integrase